MPSSSPASGGLLLALGAAGAYGFNITFARIAALDGVSGPIIIIYRVLLLVLLAAGLAVLLRRSLLFARDAIEPMLVLGMASAGVGLCYISSVAFIPVLVAAVVFYTFPILIVLASPFVDGRPLSGALLAIALTAFIGVVLVVGPGFGSLDPRGLLLAAGASAAAAIQFFAAARCASVPIVPKVFWVQVCSLPTSILVAFVTVGMAGPSALLASPLAVTLTILGFLVGFVLQMMSLARISAVVAGLVFCFEPLVAVITSAAVLGERLSLLQYVGGALVIAAIVGNVLREHHRQRPAGALAVVKP
jgi:drug/metabolite transporter (DMT)-like permease